MVGSREGLPWAGTLYSCGPYPQGVFRGSFPVLFHLFFFNPKRDLSYLCALLYFLFSSFYVLNTNYTTCFVVKSKLHVSAYLKNATTSMFVVIKIKIPKRLDSEKIQCDYYLELEINDK